MKHLVFALAMVMSFAGWNAASAQSNEIAPPALVEAAKKEGRLTIYTVMDPENELKLIREFNKRFPFIKVEMLRLPGGQLVTRVKAESGAGRLGADLIAFAEPEEAEQVEDVYAAYSPPNAKDYPAAEKGSNVWPRAIGAWCIASNTALVQDPPKSWRDLTKPEYKGRLGEVTILTGGSGWTRSMFQREVLGVEYWQALANNNPRIYPSGVPMTDALIRGEISVAAIVVNQMLPKVRDGAPAQCVFGPEGVPAKSQMIGITKTSASPNAAKLYLNWALSPEAQSFVVKEWFMFSALEGAPKPAGAEEAKLWFVDPNRSKEVRATWTNDWVKMFNVQR